MYVHYFQIEDVLREYILSDDKYSRVCELLLQEMHKGLEKKEGGDLKMFPTYVRSLPDGSGKCECVCVCVHNDLKMFPTYVHRVNLCVYTYIPHICTQPA